MAAQDDKKVLQLVAAGLPLQDVKKQLGFRDIRQVERALSRALNDAGRGRSAESERLVEVERLDAMYRSLYPKALRGDLNAAEKCLRIGETRLRLLSLPGAQGDGLLAAFTETVEALGLGVVDQAAVSAGRAVAAQIDWAVRHGVGQEVTKALYLLPHLMNVLRELGATPAARNEVASAAPVVGERPQDDLQEFLGEHLRAV